MFTMKNQFIIYIISFLLTACSVEYGMIDGSIDADTFSVELFEEQAANAPSGYGAVYTDFLKDYMISRTKLNLKKENADIEIFGRVTFFNTSPVSVTSNEGAGSAQISRLNVTIAVSVINNVNEEQSFESNFSQFSDFSADQDLSAVQDELLDDINEKLSQDIINRLTSNW